ncbi:RidA family protein [Nakamurella panacisegetis]|uniref:RidA family protein n=1 Tax=Nakamurella panacisegetis TaxID=1090615 RepID=UPI000B8602F0
MPPRRHISSGSVFEKQIGYARAVVDGEWVFLSGCTGFDYATMTMPDGVEAQTEQALRNVGSALAAAGASFADVVRVRYLLPDRADFPASWPALRAAFGDAPPAATMMQCGLMDEKMLIEIEVTARVSHR